MTIHVIQAFSAATASGALSTTTLSLPIPAGGVSANHTIILSTMRSDAAASTGGVASITDTKSNSWHVNDGFALRSGTVEVMQHRCFINNALVSGDSITVTWNTAKTVKAIAALDLSNVTSTSPRDKVGSTTVTSNPTSTSGYNGSTTSPHGALGATTQANEIVVASVGYGSTLTFTPDAGYTAGVTATTTTGSTDRKLTMIYKILSATATETPGGTLSSSSTWAIAPATFKQGASLFNVSVWNGSAEVAASLEGVYNGSTVVAADVSEIAP